MEIERKWLLKKFPNLNEAEHRKVEAVYLSTDPEIRVRRVTFDDESISHFLTLKSNGSISREEYESIVHECIFTGAKNLTSIDPIVKDHYKLKYGNHTIEFNNVDNGVFLYAEVEFESEEEADTYIFPFPDIVIKEVTYDPDYKMKNYWKRLIQK